MSIRLFIEVEQDSADFDQLNHVALEFENEVAQFDPEAGIRIVSAMIVDEFGNMVVRMENERTIYMQQDGTAMVRTEEARTAARFTRGPEPPALTDR
jgi:hypothetical protein